MFCRLDLAAIPHLNLFSRLELYEAGDNLPAHICPGWATWKTWAVHVLKAWAVGDRSSAHTYPDWAVSATWASSCVPVMSCKSYMSNTCFARLELYAVADLHMFWRRELYTMDEITHYLCEVCRVSLFWLATLPRLASLRDSFTSCVRSCCFFICPFDLFRFRLRLSLRFSRFLLHMVQHAGMYVIPGTCARWLPIYFVVSCLRFASVFVYQLHFVLWFSSNPELWEPVRWPRAALWRSGYAKYNNKSFNGCYTADLRLKGRGRKRLWFIAESELVYMAGRLHCNQLIVYIYRDN